MTGFKSKKKAAKEKLIMNTEDDEFRRIEAEAKRREQASEDDDTQGYTSEMLLAEAYRCGYKDGMEAAAIICENLPMQQQIDVRDQCGLAIRAAAIRAKGMK